MRVASNAIEVLGDMHAFPAEAAPSVLLRLPLRKGLIPPLLRDGTTTAREEE